VHTTRRGFLVSSAAGGAALAAGCAHRPASALEPTWEPGPDERARLASGAETLPLVTRGAADAAVLRRRARPIPPGLDLGPLPARMEATMRAAKGVGLAAPQVGLGLRAATLMLDYKTDHPHVVFVRNPVIVERSDETLEGYEGCLSVPGVGGLVRRNVWIEVRHESTGGEAAFIEAEGANAVLWQHELDHLDGVLYLDRLLGELLPMDEVRRRRKAAEGAQLPVSAAPGLPLEGLLHT